MTTREEKWKEVEEIISKAKEDLSEVEEILDDIQQISLMLPIKRGA